VDVSVDPRSNPANADEKFISDDYSGIGLNPGLKIKNYQIRNILTRLIFNPPRFQSPELFWRLETNSTSSICSKPVEDPVQLEMGDYQEEL
jgi:hypothetical protein